jgi:hypothetical protein
MNQPKRLTEKNKDIFFKQKFLDYELCVYSMSFLFRDVKRLSLKHNISILYCPPKSYGYMVNGSTCFMILPTPLPKQKKIHMFNINELIT